MQPAQFVGHHRRSSSAPLAQVLAPPRSSPKFPGLSVTNLDRAADGPPIAQLAQLRLRSAAIARAERKADPVSLMSGRHISASLISALPLLDIWQAPEVDAVLSGIAMALHAHMRAAPADRLGSHERLERFSEVRRPLEPAGGRPCVEQLLPVGTVRAFLALLHKALDIDSSVLITALIYVERVVQNGWPLLPHTWRRMLLAALLAAAKVLFDELVYNCDLTSSFPDWDLADINELEHAFCEAMQYCFHVRSSTYANYFFSLNSLPNSERRRGGSGGSANAQAVRDAVAQSVGTRIELKSIAHGAQRQAPVPKAGGADVPRRAAHSRPCGQSPEGGLLALPESPLAVARLESFP